MSFLEDLAQSLEHLSLPVDAPVLVAYSGGLDSTALLRGLHQLLAPARLRAAHIHHDLHPDAGRWAAHCEKECRALNIPLACRHVQCARRGGESLENEARKARYAALAALMQPGEWLMTAHHQQDQAETFFLQLFRGAGIDGLAAMKTKRSFAHGMLARPLLHMPRRDLEHFLRERAATWVEDPGNASPRHKRNRIRHRLFPLLQAMEGENVAGLVARSAANLEDAKTLIEEVSAQDWMACSNGHGVIRRRPFRELSPSRQRYALRHGIAKCAYPIPDRASLERLRSAIAGAVTGVTLEWAGGRLWLHGDDARFFGPASPSLRRDDWLWLPSAGSTDAFPWRAKLAPVQSGDTTRASFSAMHHDLHPRYFQEALWIRYRQGGERYISVQGKTRLLKKALQEMGVFPALRASIPLLYNQAGELLAVPGFFSCLPALAPARSEWVMRMQRIG